MQIENHFFHILRNSKKKTSCIFPLLGVVFLSFSNKIDNLLIYVMVYFVH